MSLFESKDIEVFDVKEVSTSKAMGNDFESMITLGKAYQKVDEVIGQILPNINLHYFTAGEWSCHELLFHLLKQTGPAKVYVATWSMSELAARQMMDAIANGLITELQAVLDYRTQNRHPGAYQLARTICASLKTTSLHAKVFVIENEGWMISVSGSANFTNNPRIERGVICSDKSVAAFDRDAILELLNNADPFEMK